MGNRKQGHDGLEISIASMNAASISAEKRRRQPTTREVVAESPSGNVLLPGIPHIYSSIVVDSVFERKVVKPPPDNITVNTSRPKRSKKNDRERRTNIAKLQYAIESQKVETRMYRHKLEVLLDRGNIIHDTLNDNLKRGELLEMKLNPISKRQMQLPQTNLLY